MPIMGLPKMEPFIHTCGRKLDLNKEDVFEFTVCKKCIKIIPLADIEVHARAQISNSTYRRNTDG